MRSYGDGLDLGRAQALNRGDDILFLERLHDFAVRADPLANLQTERPFHQVARLAPVQIERLRAHDALNAQHVPKALCGDEADARPAALDEHVGANGGAMHEVLDGCRVDLGLGKGVEDAGRGRGGRRERLRDLQPGVAIGGDQVGERAAHIDRDVMWHSYAPIQFGQGLVRAGRRCDRGAGDPIMQAALPARHRNAPA